MTVTAALAFAYGVVGVVLVVYVMRLWSRLQRVESQRDPTSSSARSVPDR